MRCATRQWGKLRVAARHEGHGRLVQRDVAATRQQVARWEQNQSQSHRGAAAAETWERRASFATEELQQRLATSPIIRRVEVKDPALGSG